MRVREEPQRPLHLADEIRQHRLQAPTRIVFNSGGLLAAFRFRCSALANVSFSSLDRAPREVIAAERNRPLPDDLFAVGDDEVGAIGADVEGDDAVFLAPRPVVLVVGGSSASATVCRPC